MQKKGLLLIVAAVMISGCALVRETVPKDELFENETTLSDGRKVLSTFDVKYNNVSLLDQLRDEKIDVDDYLKSLHYVDSLNDGGSTLYEYKDDLKFSGISSYYVLSCNSLGGIKDIFIAKNKDNLSNKCTLKIDDLEGVSMEIKKGTLSDKGLTVVITDTSNRENIYGSFYKVEKYKDNEWVELNSKTPMVFNEMAFYPNEEHKVEFDINWLAYYGRLNSGKYRLVKSTNFRAEGTQHFITAEFNIK